MKRRDGLLIGAGAAAAAAGLGWQLWRESSRTAGPAELAASATPATSGTPVSPTESPTADLWTLAFEKPEGGTFTMASLRGRPLLLNFWGTWCPPCVKEMPDLDRFARQFKAQGWRVVGLAVDNAKAVRDFLARSPVSYTIGLAGFEGSDLARRLGNEQSGLPYTVAFAANGTVLQRKAGATTLDELTRWALPR